MAGDLPDGFTVDQPAASAGALPDGFTVDSLPSGFTVDNNASPPPPQDIMSRTGADVAQRVNNLQDIQNQVDAGKISAPSGFLQRMGQVAGAGVIDPSTEILKSLGQYVPDSYNRAVNNSINGLNNAASSLPGMQAYNGAVTKSMAGIPQFQQAHPEAAGDIGAALNVASVLPIGAAEEAAAKGATGAIGAGRDALNAASDKAVDAAMQPVEKTAPNPMKATFTPPEQQAVNFWQNRVTPAQAKQVAQLKYAEADQAGASLTPQKRNQFIDAAYGADKGADGNIVPPSPLAQKILDNLDATRDQPLTLRGAQNIEQDINKNITYQQNGMLTPESAQLLKIKSALRDAINSAQPSDMVGGSQAWQSWNDAKKAYSATGILTDINNMINKSTYADQPATQLKRNLGRWSTKQANVAGLEPDEMDLVKDAIKTDFANEILRSGSSRLVPIGAAALGLGSGHGIAGAAIGTATGMGGRNIGFAYQLNKMGDLADAIGERLPSMNKPAVAPTPPLQLAPPVWQGAQNHPGFAGPVTGDVTPPPMTPFQARAQAAKAAASQPTPETEKIYAGRRGTAFAGTNNLPETTATIAARIGEDPRPLVQQFHGATPEQFENMTPDQKEAAVSVAQRNRAIQTKTGPVLNVGENAEQFGQSPLGPRQRPDVANAYQPTENELNASGQNYSRTATGTSQRPFQGDMPNQFEAAAQQKYGEARAANEDDLQKRWQQYKASDEYQSSDAAKERQAQSDKYTGKDAPKSSAFAQMPDNDGRYSTDEFNFVKSNKGGPIQFNNQKQAAQWILKKGHANSPDQIFDIANHPSGKGFTVKQTGTGTATGARTANTRFEQPEYNANVAGENKGNLLGQNSGGRIKGKIGFNLKKSKT